MHENEIGSIIIDSAVYLHKDLGPGLLETVYEVTLTAKLRKLGLMVSDRCPFLLNTKAKSLMKVFELI